MYQLPALSNATPAGEFNLALVANPPSPEKPAVPVPTTAVIPGKKAPILVTADMVKGMIPGSVILDLAAERGGNCELTKPGEVSVQHGVTIIGRYNIAGTAPYHASQLYARNLTNFLLNLFKKKTQEDQKTELNLDDDIVRETLLTQGGEVSNPRVREFFSLPALAAQGKS